MGRIACAYVPRFELALHARARPEVWTSPVAVVELAGGGRESGSITHAAQGQRVRACSPEAERVGVAQGQLVSHARGLCPELEILAPDEAAGKAAEREVLESLARLSPWLDADGRGAFFLGLEGLARLVKSERKYGEDIRAALKKLDFAAQVALADGPFIAWVTARRLSGITSIPPGTEARHLSRIPVSDLGLSDRAMELCSLLGVASAGALAKLPAGALARRLGAEGARLERLCRGEVLTAWPSAAKVPVAPESATLELEVATDALEPLLFLSKSLLDRLLAALAHARCALVELSIIARLDTKAELRHALCPAEPTLDVKALSDLLRLWLDTKPFPAPVVALTFVASKTGAAQARQLSLFQQREQEEYAALERAVARLASAFGTQAVVRPTLNETFRPEARLSWVPFVPGSEQAEGASTPGPGPPHSVPRGESPRPMMLKLLSPPEPVAWTGSTLRRPGKPPLHVVHADGPHRLCGEWWDAPFDRSYYWLAGAAGEMFWVFRDEENGESFLTAEGD